MSIVQGPHYQTMGEGPDLVLIHGWGIGSSVWQVVASSLSQHYRVHLVDLPGFNGEPTLPEYSLAAVAETLLNQLPERAIWCGWSLGGLVATHVAAHFPERVIKLIQVCSSLKFVQQGEWLGVTKDIFETFKAGVVTHPEKTLKRFLSLQAMGSVTVKNDIAIIKDHMSQQVAPLPSALVAGLVLLSEVDLRADFQQISVPSLNLFGQADTLVPLTNLANVKNLLPMNQQVVFENSSHAPFISEPERFQQVIYDFINE